MCFFRRKKSLDSMGIDEMLKYICKKPVKYVSIRRATDPTEEVLGKAGYINYKDGRVIISADMKIVLDRPVSELKVGELMSKNGATFSYVEDGEKMTVIAYYSYYRK